ncbi:glutamate-5-semialdehyde dehydrogenase [Neoactinobaculum massilliense]|uniref:glutamate-5-semialdehyde dehydrogenase n=1 Tax=Neoactinobaculum massilliense TaxID=2364794 RepID=UPI000F5460D2|nr:glutamate-5-semialdehyde dehydrogenase [Neoactinobaculum massilliense]
MITESAQRARTAARILALAGASQKNTALECMARALDTHRGDILAANAEDVARAREAGTPDAIVDRLTLTDQRIDGMAAGLRTVAGLPDPVGEVERGWTAAGGVRITQVRVPMGVIGMIYEARPNVTADAAGICLKAGNAVLLRGSSSALTSNRAIAAALRSGLEEAGLPADGVVLLEGGHEIVAEMMHARGLIDLLIPRGGAGLISRVVEGATVPVIETGLGNCHLFIDASAQPEMAVKIALNAKAQRPSVCNAIETILVHRDCVEEMLPALLGALLGAGVTIHGDDAVLAAADKSGAPSGTVVAATAEDWSREYLSLDVAMRVVDSFDAAVTHIQRYSTGHSETIVTESRASAEAFTRQIDAAAVLVNASSRFVDGGEFGFGAEIGISTQKLHARGPMAVREMTTTKYVVSGDGQVRA